jgi:hypothetical protein
VRPWFALFAASIVAVAACGARSSLREDAPRTTSDAGPDADDAGPDADDAADAMDVMDAPEVFDAPPDVEVFPDAAITDCQDAGTTYIYLVSSENALVRFYPPDLSFTTIGTIDCPTTTAGATPFSMAVDRQGIAYVLFNDGELFRVSTLTASCKPTAFVAAQGGFPLGFGMGFSSNANDPGETLFVSGNDFSDGGSAKLLGSIDVFTFNLSTVGMYDKIIGNPELTGTADARLFGFGPGIPDSHLSELDKSNASVISDTLVQLNQNPQSAWAFAFWGGDFYFFTTAAVQGTTEVHRYTPGGSTSPPAVASIDLTIVGAGVSTCAPSE